MSCIYELYLLELSVSVFPAQQQTKEPPPTGYSIQVKCEVTGTKR